MTNATYRCSKCRETKPLADFYKDNNGKRRPRCKACRIAAVMRRYVPTGTPRGRPRKAVTLNVAGEPCARCSRCRNDKPLSEFTLRPTRVGRLSWCRRCYRDNARERYAREIEMRAAAYTWFSPRFPPMLADIEDRIRAY
jgi:NAD-dependent SIR2 family protein deacetylase